MALAIRLARAGSKKRPFYRIVVADKRAPRDGRFIEKLGTHNPLLPKDSAERTSVVADRIEYWLKEGAKPTDRCQRILASQGIGEFKAGNNPVKGKPGKKALERIEEQKQKEEARKEAEAEAKEAAKAAAEAEAAAPAEEAPAEEAPAEEAPAAEAPAEEAPAAEAEEKTDA